MHLDEILLLRLADGERVSAGDEAHVQSCAICGARLDELRAESLATGAALALDPDELHFLMNSALPTLVVARAVNMQQRSSPLPGLLWVIFPAALMYAGWLLAGPLISTGLAFARRAGVASYVAGAAARGLIAALDLFASAVEITSALPGFGAPLVSLSFLALLTLAMLLLAPNPDGQRRSLAA